MQDQKKKLQASRATPPPPAPVAAPNTSSGFFDAVELDQLVKSRRAASSTSLVSSKPSVGSALDDLDALFGGPPTFGGAATDAAQPSPGAAPSAAPAQDFFGHDDDLLGVGLGSTVRHDSLAPSQHVDPPVAPGAAAGHDELLPGFGPAIVVQPKREPPPAPPRRAAENMPDAFVPGSPSHVPSQGSMPREAAPASAVPRYEDLYGAGAPASRPAERERGSLWTSSTVSGEDDFGSDTHADVQGGDFWAAPRRPVPRPPGAADEGAPAGASSELSQRAQRAFQSSAAWFARASRKIQDSVRDLQERHGGARRAGSPGGDCEAVYRDWAAQIERQSPRTRAAMLGALSADDRAAVERIARARGGAAAASPHPGSRAERSHSNRPAEAVSPRAWTPVDGAWSDGEASPLSVQETSQHLAQALREAHLGGAPEAGEALGSPARAARPRPASPLAPRRATAEPAPEFDLMGLTDDAPRAAPAQAARKSSSADHIEALFSVAPPRPSSAAAGGTRPPPGASVAAGGAKPFTDAPTQAACAERPPRSAPPSAEDGPEPEERRRLREARLAAQRAKMAASLAEARERDSAEASDKAARVAIREALAPQMDAWVSGRRDNIRALLSTLHTVLWEGSGWKAPSIADIVEDAQVKRWYMKANLVVHPDKVRQKGGSPEAVARADMIFDVLKSAWGKFETQR